MRAELSRRHSSSEPSPNPRPGWRESIGDARVQIEDILNDSPSLKREVEAIISHQTERGARLAIADLEDRGELDDSLRIVLDLI